MTEATVSFAGNLTDDQACDRTTLGSRRALATPRNRSWGRPEVRGVPSPSLQEVVVARLRVLVGAILAAALVLAFAAPASASGGGTAKVRAFHNSPDTPPVDIYVNGAKTLSNVSYGTLSDYLKVPKGTYNVQAKVAPSTASDPAALQADVRFGRRPTTIAAIGSRTGDGGPLQLKVLGDRDTYSRHLTRLRVAHTAPTPQPWTSRPSWPAAGSGSSGTWRSARPAATCWPRPASTGCGSSPPGPAPWSRTWARSGSRAAPPPPPGRSAS
jgi:hypothetical protein